MKPGMRIILAPALIAMALALILVMSIWADTALTLRFTLPAMVLLIGLLITAGLYLRWQIVLRQQAQAQARISAAQLAAVEERRQFLQRLDHELKNPLMVIRAALANIPSPEPQAEAVAPLSAIEHQTLRLARLTTDLRKLVDLDQRPLERTPILIPELLQEMIDLAREQPEAETRAISLTLPQVPWPLAPLNGDRDLLALAIYNLLDNALKFSRPQDQIEIRAFEDRSQLIIEVADTGLGIDPADLPHVWDELYRGNSTRNVAGSGLGLALVRAILVRHGGTVELRSRLGQGTIVSLRLPLQPAEHSAVTKR